MNPNTSFGVIPEANLPTAWREVGDVDECAPCSDLMCVHAIAGWLPLPGTTAYRAAAGNPDDPTQGDGLGIRQSEKALRALYPKLTAAPGFAVTEYIAGGVTGSDVAGAILARKSMASVSVIAGALPEHGTFTGQHRVAICSDGTNLTIGNPLKPGYTLYRPITVAQLATAINVYPKGIGGGVIFFPSVEEAFKTHPLYGTQDATEQQLAAARAAGFNDGKTKALSAVNSITL